VFGQAFIALVEELKDWMSIQDIYMHLGVARSTYYYWKKESGKVSEKEKRNQAIGEASKAHKFRYSFGKLHRYYRELAGKQFKE